jgi:hypothetical protein
MSDGGPVAVKVLKATRGEPYERFRSEVEVLQRLGDRPGLLPLLDSHLPLSPARSDPAWLAMPLATPIEDQLGPNPELRTVVDVMGQIARALAELAEEGVGRTTLKGRPSIPPPSRATARTRYTGKPSISAT